MQTGHATESEPPALTQLYPYPQAPTKSFGTLAFSPSLQRERTCIYSPKQTPLLPSATRGHNQFTHYFKYVHHHLLGVSSHWFLNTLISCHILKQLKVFYNAAHFGSLFFSNISQEGCLQHQTVSYCPGASLAIRPQHMLDNRFSGTHLKHI